MVAMTAEELATRTWDALEAETARAIREYAGGATVDCRGIAISNIAGVIRAAVTQERLRLISDSYRHHQRNATATVLGSGSDNDKDEPCGFKTVAEFRDAAIAEHNQYCEALALQSAAEAKANDDPGDEQPDPKSSDYQSLVFRGDLMEGANNEPGMIVVAGPGAMTFYDADGQPAQTITLTPDPLPGWAWKSEVIEGNQTVPIDPPPLPDEPLDIANRPARGGYF